MQIYEIFLFIANRSISFLVLKKMNRTFGVLLVLAVIAQFAQPVSAGSGKRFEQVREAANKVRVWVKKNPVPAGASSYGGYSLVKEGYKDFNDCVDAYRNGAGNEKGNLTRDICSTVNRNQ